MATEARAIVLMGVSGSGKTALGQRLADALGWPFFEGDDFHPARNVAKMAAGQPLDDADRAPWLVRLSNLIADQLAAGRSLVLACSALKAAYRQRLASDHADQVSFVFLEGDYDLIRERMLNRSGHYMPIELLRSQFQALEIPQDALRLSVERPLSELVEQVRAALKIKPAE